MSEQGYHTLEISDADEALQTLHCVRADLLVLDAQHLCDQTQRLLRALRDDPGYRDTPVLIVGATRDECQTLKPSVRPGAVILKDEPFEDVLRNVRSYVAGRAGPYN